MSPKSLHKKLIALLLILAVIATSGCEVPSEAKFRVTGNKTIGIKIGQRLKIELEGNPTTGYLWQVTDISQKGVIEEVGKYEYLRDSDLIGSGGVQIFSFKSLKKGTTVVSFEYKRTWETVAAAKKYNVKIIVH